METIDSTHLSNIIIRIMMRIMMASGGMQTRTQPKVGGWVLVKFQLGLKS